MTDRASSQNPFPSLATRSGYQTIAGACGESDMLRLVTGNHVKIVDLVNVATVGLPLQLRLTYNAQETILGPVGNKWRHTCMMSLLITGSPATQISLVEAGGRQYSFVLSGSDWVLEEDSYFYPGTLSAQDSNWAMTLSNGTVYLFDALGHLISMTDPHGNETTLRYAEGLLVSITEPTGRKIVLSYTGGLLSHVWDPMGNLTLLFYEDDNLTQIVGPEGCVKTYGYDSENRIVSSTDPLGNVMTYAYHEDDEENRLWQVTNAESPPQTITYTYDTVEENLSDFSPSYDAAAFARTTLVDARGQTWEYRFDYGGNMRRVLYPTLGESTVGHQSHFYWDPNQRLLFESGGFPFVDYPATDRIGPRDNLNNRFHRYATDARGNTTHEFDANGIVNHVTYNDMDLVTSTYPGQASIGVQGNWPGQYGSDGYLLCAFNDGSSDLASLPAYVSSVTAVTPGTLPRVHLDSSTNWAHLMDPRTPAAPSAPRREMGFWRTASDGFEFQVNLSGETAFNLTLYSNSVDQPYVGNTPLMYAEQPGRDITITIVDLDGTQSFRLYNNSPGFWVTFPVRGDDENPISVTVAPAPGSSNSDARISAVMFDPLDSRRTSMTYNETGDPLTVTDPLGNQTAMTYNDDGTLATRTDALSNETAFYYEDDYKNLTRIVDAASEEWLRTYDLNGNVLTRTDPNDHTWTMTYDGRNRLISTTDPLGNVTRRTYDAAGNIIAVQDPMGAVTAFEYSPSNRLVLMTDALGNQTAFGYDASGKLTSVTDARGNTTEFEFDEIGRLVQVVRPDGTIVASSYDALDRLRAVTTPNGTQGDISQTNVRGAMTLALNGDIETPDPASATQAWKWLATPTSSGNIRDTSVSHSGEASLRLALSSGSQYWSQSSPLLAAGSRAVLRAWVRPDGTADTADVALAMRVRTLDSSVTELTGSTTVLPASSEAWQQVPWFRFTVPGDAQYAQCPVESLRAHGSSDSMEYCWFDDFELYMLSTALSYDLEGRVQSARTPDGGSTQWIRDRAGRVTAILDPRGRVTALGYDSLDRIIRVTDPNGDTVAYSYNAVGLLATFTDPRGNVTAYSYDALLRLETITYPDTTTEAFTYDPASNLLTYTNNRGQVRTYAYDDANRLLSVTYETDDTEVTFERDRNGNVVRRTERNGDLFVFEFDALNRVVAVQCFPGEGSGTAAWAHQNTYDEVGNRTGFYDDPPLFDSADFDDFVYGGAHAWMVPATGFDEMNRMLRYRDRLDNQTWFEYDNEGRRTQITYPNGTPAPVTQAMYDVMSRLLSQDTAKGTTSLATQGYSYDLGSNRTSIRSGGDNIDFALDAANRLVREAQNQFIEDGRDFFAAGAVDGAEVTSAGTVTLLPFADSFDGTAINGDRWRFNYTQSGYVGMEVRQKDGLHFAFPRGYTNLNSGANDPPVRNDYGVVGSPISVQADHRTITSGDFDVQVDFSSFQGKPDATGNYNLLGIIVSNGNNVALMGISNQQPGYRGLIIVGGTPVVDAHHTSSDTSGKFRITRSSSTVSLYWWDGSAWVLQWSYGSFTTSDVTTSLYFTVSSSVASGTLSNFTRTTPSEAYLESGTYTSGIYDAGSSVTWSAISWSADTPSGTSVEFQVAVGDDPQGPWDYVGPDGTLSTYFTSPDNLPELEGRYARYQATLAGDGTDTPVISEVAVTFEGANDPEIRRYAFDGAGNITRKTTINADGTTTEVRDDASWPTEDRINNLNQIIRIDLTPLGGPTTTNICSYDASGNLTSKTQYAAITGDISNGSDTVSSVSSGDIALLTVGAIVRHSAFPPGTTVATISTTSFTASANATATVSAATIFISQAEGTSYSWDEDNRLLEVAHIGSSPFTVTNTYDSLGRWLTRTDGSDVTKFEWDGFDCVREIAPDDTRTTYYIPQGEIMSFERGDETYQVHSDALGCVRGVTDSTGAVVSHWEFSAWGEELPSSEDGVPGGFPYRFVGALGVRLDATTGLHYMRRRWYDASLSRFIGRDPIGRSSGFNLYLYCSNKPLRYVDPLGLDEGPLNGRTYANPPTWKDIYSEASNILAKIHRLNPTLNHPHPVTKSAAFFTCLAYSESTFRQNATAYGIPQSSPKYNWGLDFHVGLMQVSYDSVVGQGGVKAETYMFTGKSPQQAWGEAVSFWDVNLEVGINLFALGGWGRFEESERKRVEWCERCLKEAVDKAGGVSNCNDAQKCFDEMQFHQNG